MSAKAPHLQDRAEALSRFKEVAEAYEVLSNPENRKAYDLYHGFQINKLVLEFLLFQFFFSYLNIVDCVILFLVCLRENPSVRNRQFRRFSGMKGSFQVRILFRIQSLCIDPLMLTIQGLCTVPLMLRIQGLCRIQSLCTVPLMLRIQGFCIVPLLFRMEGLWMKKAPLR